MNIEFYLSRKEVSDMKYDEGGDTGGGDGGNAGSGSGEGGGM